MIAKAILSPLCALTCWASVVSSTASLAESTRTSIVHKAPEAGGPRRFEVVTDSLWVFSAPSVNSKRIVEHSRDDVLSNLGCEALADDVWCRVAPFRGGARGYARALHVQPAKGPDGRIPIGIDDSKPRTRGQDFDAKTKMACAQEQGQALGKCSAAISRSDGGDATMVVTFPNGFARQLYFTHGEFMRGSATMSGVGTDIEWALDAGTYTIRVDDQRFEIPESFVLGK